MRPSSRCAPKVPLGWAISTPTIPQSSRAKSEVGAAGHLQPQFLYRDFVSDLEDLAPQERGKATKIHLLFNDIHPAILHGQNARENPINQTLLSG